jgi:diaminohydroxyphosphoribosylaminopyrimidine deaminase/5-amino-6-(5-phosphoribosylamino)uracil reductase
MRVALDQASLGLYSTGENPRVGAVITKHARILAQGFHQTAGGAHAEIEALSGVTEHESRGATCYVTLEPCNHTGKTGPCTEALIARGVTRVVAAMEDPNPEVSGSGVSRLRQAGIQVDVGLFASEARALNAGFMQRMTEGRPLVWLKSAASLDGRTAMATGESKWITGPHARMDVQTLRARVGAVVTGIETIRADDPRLTVRWSEAEIPLPPQATAHQPLRVVLDTHGRLPDDCALFDAPGEILWVTGIPTAHPRLEDGRMASWVAPTAADGRIDLHALCLELGRRGVNELLVEAGSTLAGAWIRAGLVDRGVLYMAPKLLGPGGLSLYDVAPAQLADAPALFISDVRKIGDDLRVDWTLGVN